MKPFHNELSKLEEKKQIDEILFENSPALPASVPLQLMTLLNLSYRIRKEPKKQIKWVSIIYHLLISRYIRRFILD